jgi:hypothetical protein
MKANLGIITPYDTDIWPLKGQAPGLGAQLQQPRKAQELGSNWSRTAEHPLILPAAALVFLVPSREH